MNKIINIFLFLLIFLTENLIPTEIYFQPEFKLGNETLLQGLEQLQGKKVAVITNQTGITSKGNHILDELLQRGVNIVKIFTPEHGIRGDEAYSGKDDKTGLPIISLYGEKLKPSKQDLGDVDVLIYDIQDVGARFYTYTSTLLHCIEAAHSNQKKIIVCDRPIILNPDYVDGFILDDRFQSFVGKIPTPVCYGMTCGELALFIADKLYGAKEIVSVSRMQGYFRTMNYDSLKLNWVKPSPSMFTSTTALCYPATCFLEGTNVSEGRGSEKPFEYFGAPWCSGDKLASELNSFNLEGVLFEEITFTPSEKISAYPPKFFNQKCNGVYIKVIDKRKFEPVKTGIAILYCLNKNYKKFGFSKNNFIDFLAGTDRLRQMLNAGSSYEVIIKSWEVDVEIFSQIRKQFLLYD